MTDENDDAQPADVTVTSDLPESIAGLGIDAQAEFIRLREKLGLSDEPRSKLGYVGRYELLDEIGRGGMGIVYRGRDPQLDRLVAIKVVRALTSTRHEQLRIRLLREAKVLAKLTHPNVVRVYDSGEHRGEVYLAMEYVEGSTLRAWQRDRPRRAILEAYAAAARGLAAAHELGIVHRDFKPENVLVADDGRVLVGDFGLAGIPAETRAGRDDPTVRGRHDDRGSATRTGALLGTPSYMAPEQLRGERVTARSDVFAFCVSLWEALAGQRPFDGERPKELLGQIGRARPAHAKRIPRRLRSRLLEGLADDPNARPDDLVELADVVAPRHSRLMHGGIVGLVAGLAIGGLVWTDEPEAAECDLRTELLKARDELESSELGPHLRRAGLSSDDVRVREYFERIDADMLCRPSTSAAARADLELRLSNLSSLLEMEPTTSPLDLHEAIGELTSHRPPPPTPLSPEISQAIRDVFETWLAKDRDRALRIIDETLETAERQRHEIAALQRWRGRILALQGKHLEATSAYQEATVGAVASYPGMQLEIDLLMAKTAAMRLREPDRARDALARARGAFDHFGEPAISIDRSDYHEVMASVLKQEGELPGAIRNQWISILMRYVHDDRLKLGMGLYNLATLYEQLSEKTPLLTHRMATSWAYETAYDLLQPLESSAEWLQASFGLGHWMLHNDSDDGWGDLRSPPRLRTEAMLERVAKESEDLRVPALTDLLRLRLAFDDESAVLSAASRLEQELSDARDVPPDKRLDAYLFLAIAAAATGDRQRYEDFRERYCEGVDGHTPSTDEVGDLDDQACALWPELAPRPSRFLACP